MTKFFALTLAVVLSTGCTVQPGAVQLPGIPQAQQATTTAQATPISQPAKTGVDVGVTIQEQAPVVVHNTPQAEPKVDPAKVTGISFSNGSDSMGNQYSNVEVSVNYNKAMHYVDLYVWDKDNNKVTDYQYSQQIIRPNQKSFALSSPGMKYDTTYYYMITANDVKTDEQVVLQGSFKTGGGKLSENNPLQPAFENRDPIVIGNFRSEVGSLGMTADGLWYKELVHVPTDTELSQIHNTLGDGMGNCANVTCTEAYDIHWTKGQDIFDTGIPSWLVTRLDNLAKQEVSVKAMAVYSGYWAGPIIVINKSK